MKYHALNPSACASADGGAPQSWRMHCRRGTATGCARAGTPSPGALHYHHTSPINCNNKALPTGEPPPPAFACRTKVCREGSRVGLGSRWALNSGMWSRGSPNGFVLGPPQGHQDKVCRPRRWTVPDLSRPAEGETRSQPMRGQPCRIAVRPFAPC